MDLVEMPGQFTRRGGILDVYSPEADRPVRSSSSATRSRPFANSIPKRSAPQSGLDETQLLPLTETPVTEHLLAAVNARLSRQRIETEDEEMAAEAAAAGGVSVFPGWEFFRPCRRRALAAHALPALRAVCR
jgi:transcription-repair coupling factor (superfamily II helicase)